MRIANKGTAIEAGPSEDSQDAYTPIELLKRKALRNIAINTNVEVKGGNRAGSVCEGKFSQNHRTA